LFLTGKWVNLENIRLSEVSQVYGLVIDPFQSLKQEMSPLMLFCLEFEFRMAAFFIPAFVCFFLSNSGTMLFDLASLTLVKVICYMNSFSNSCDPGQIITEMSFSEAVLLQFHFSNLITWIPFLILLSRCIPKHFNALLD
jgi:hypothetical protein